MKSNLIKNSVKGIGLGLFMMFGIMAFSSTEANAQYRNRDDQNDRRDDRNDRRDRRDDRYGNNGGYNGTNIYREAQRQGFQDGVSRGRDDRQDRDRYNPQKSSEYKRATNGYDSRYGNKNEYKNAYRQAFINGYNQGYNRNGRGNGRGNGTSILGNIFGY